MEEVIEYDGMTIVGNEMTEDGDQPLLVAMQPNGEPVEMVVMSGDTDNNESAGQQVIIQNGQVQALLDTDTGEYVPIAAVEEVEEFGSEEVVTEEVVLTTEQQNHQNYRIKTYTDETFSAPRRLGRPKGTKNRNNQRSYSASSKRGRGKPKGRPPKNKSKHALQYDYVPYPIPPAPQDVSISQTYHHVKTEPGVDSADSSSDLEETTSDEEEIIIHPIEQKRAPKKRAFSHRLKWGDKNMIEAMKAVTERRMPIRGAAKQYGVPYSTLKDRVHGRVQHGTKPGVKTAMSPEEEEDLVNYIREVEASGFQLRCLDVRERAAEILYVNHGHNSPYRQGAPGHNWLAGFQKRHSGLNFKKAMGRNLVPSIPKQRQLCRKFYEILGNSYKKLRIGNKPDRIFTVAEVRIQLLLDATILLCASADGELLPPFVVFPGYKLKLTSARQAYPEAYFTCSADGQVNDTVFYWWFRDHFLRHIVLKGLRPCSLMISRNVSDINFQFMALAKEERISIVGIPEGIAHLIQPLDDSIAESLENAINKRCRKWEQDNPGNPFTQKVLAQILQKVWTKGGMSQRIGNRFDEVGAYPLNNQAISQERLVWATAVIRESQQPSGLPTVEDNPLAGLSLLSALSTHESALNTHESGATRDSSEMTSTNHSKSSPEPSTSSSHDSKEKVVVKLNKRSADELEEDDIAEETVSGASVSADQEIINMIQPPESKRRKQTPRIHEQIVSAKVNKDQINAAIASIGGNVEESTAADHVIVEQMNTNSQDEYRKTQFISEEVPIEMFAEDGEEDAGQVQEEVITEEVGQFTDETGQVYIQQEIDGEITEIPADQSVDVSEELVKEEVVSKENNQVVETVEQVLPSTSGQVEEGNVSKQVITGSALPPELLKQILSKINAVQGTSGGAPRVREIRIVQPARQKSQNVNVMQHNVNTIRVVKGSSSQVLTSPTRVITAANPRPKIVQRSNIQSNPTQTFQVINPGQNIIVGSQQEVEENVVLEEIHPEQVVFQDEVTEEVVL